MEEVEVKINDMEAKAILQLIADSKVPAEMGYILTTLKYKLVDAFQKQQDAKTTEAVLKNLKTEEDEE